VCCQSHIGYIFHLVVKFSLTVSAKKSKYCSTCIERSNYTGWNGIWKTKHIMLKRVDCGQISTVWGPREERTMPVITQVFWGIKNFTHARNGAGATGMTWRSTIQSSYPIFQNLTKWWKIFWTVILVVIDSVEIQDLFLRSQCALSGKVVMHILTYATSQYVIHHKTYNMKFVPSTNLVKC